VRGVLHAVSVSPRKVRRFCYTIQEILNRVGEPCRSVQNNPGKMNGELNGVWVNVSPEP
jgi:hypothetical protein